MKLHDPGASLREDSCGRTRTPIQPQAGVTNYTTQAFAPGSNTPPACQRAGGRSAHTIIVRSAHCTGNTPRENYHFFWLELRTFLSEYPKPHICECSVPRLALRWLVLSRMPCCGVEPLHHSGLKVAVDNPPRRRVLSLYYPISLPAPLGVGKSLFAVSLSATLDA